MKFFKLFLVLSVFLASSVALSFPAKLIPRPGGFKNCKYNTSEGRELIREATKCLNESECDESKPPEFLKCRNAAAVACRDKICVKEIKKPHKPEMKRPHKGKKPHKRPHKRPKHPPRKGDRHEPPKGPGGKCEPIFQKFAPEADKCMRIKDDGKRKACFNKLGQKATAEHPECAKEIDDKVRESIDGQPPRHPERKRKHVGRRHKNKDPKGDKGIKQHGECRKVSKLVHKKVRGCKKFKQPEKRFSCLDKVSNEMIGQFPKCAPAINDQIRHMKDNMGRAMHRKGKHQKAERNDKNQRHERNNRHQRNDKHAKCERMLNPYKKDFDGCVRKPKKEQKEKCLKKLEQKLVSKYPDCADFVQEKMEEAPK